MTIYPTPYACLKSAIKAGLIHICIDRALPPNYTGYRYQLLAPYSYTLTPAYTRGLFALEYKKILSGLDVKETVNGLERLSCHSDVALFASGARPGKDFVAMVCEWMEKGGAQIGRLKRGEMEDNQISMF